MEIIMRERHLRVMKNAIAERAEEGGNPGRPSKRAFRVATVVCCVELGDTKALEFWIGRVRENAATDPIGDDEAIIEAAEYILEKWKDVENVHGQGALTNYRHRLNHSPAEHIGLAEIENAKRFQATRLYDITDRTWALEYC
ncbi:hypothetical protein HFO33_35165 [Rhizobium leguminosarum]|uniref:hypothetical protein n=1 Tax=Rhizobium leguminosarum TaxID=384 RepID=UPI001C97E801|nr:hypothetical protein [Rhizobium leguminosarum]MBY5667453.1 hypothetical protein [Rhizobium leguminosarum]MBY5709476.1 hypothetical protein [Rhizobium leguminosarum]MBY5721735.1 hypothetical protein [Rhizobium leguminosarum]